MSILVSIIIPVYNGKKFLKETIESCLHQTLINNIEIIIVDDCSQDNSLQIMEQFSLETSITIIQNEHNMGLMKTNNKAVSIAKGKYLLFLGHDDCLEKEHVEIMSKVFDEHTSIVHCNSNLIDENGKIFGRGLNDVKQYIRNYFLNYFLVLGNVIHSTGTLIDREYFDKTGGWDETYKNYGEWLLWCKLSCAGSVKYTTKVRAQYRKHATNITNTFVQPEVKQELHAYALMCREEAKKCITNSLLLSVLKKINYYKDAKR